MSDTQETPKKPHHRSPEWMAQMRVRAAAKKAENKKLKEAEKVKQQQERQKKVKEADEILNPKTKTEPKVEPHVDESITDDTENEHLNAPKTSHIKKSKKKVIVDSDEEELDYRSAYYKAKLKMLKSTPQQHTEMPPVAVAYDVAKHNVKQHFNKAMMKNLWSTYFGDSECPY
jgi:hypothetical protein